MSGLTVPCESAVTVTASTPLQHRCPYADETDSGTAHITWTCAGATIELHALTSWLGRSADRAISHEDITASLHTELSALNGIADVEVRTQWSTAGARVEVIAGVVLRKPIQRGGG